MPTLIDVTSQAPLAAAYVTIGADATLPNERALTGTSNQITVTDNGAGSTVVLSTPQSIHTGASPTFVGLTLSGLTAGSVVFAGTAGVLSQDNANLFWDAPNKYLALGTVTPVAEFHISKDAVANIVVDTYVTSVAG